jgi:small-conductance mechanosensitive channel
MFKPFGEDFAMSGFNWDPVMSWFLDHGIRVLFILGVGVALWYLLQRLLPPMVRHALKRTKGESREGIRKRTETLVGVLMWAGKILIVLIFVFMILSEFNVNIAPALAGLGIAGVAVGFGAQYLVRDLIAGVFVILENQYRVGDVVKVADLVGMVEEVNLRRTVLRDLDGIVHHVPNGEIKAASNYSRHFSRVNLDISVAYGTDLDHAIGVINRVGKELAKDKEWSKRIISAPEVLRVNKLGDSGIDIKILGDVKPLEQWGVMGELRLRLKKAFDKEGIEIPWPHLKLYFGEEPANKGLVCKACSQVNLPGSKFCSRCGAKLKR